MKVKILLNTNPFFTASASANRWLTLIEGLNDLGVSLQILVIGNYQSKAEQEKFQTVSNINGIEIKYVTSKIVVGIWQRRFYKYIGKHLQAISINKKIRNEVQNFDGILWPENDLKVWKIITSISNKSCQIISEMSEFLDIHQYNKGNALETRVADAKQAYFEKTYIQKLDGLILMTKTLMAHYSVFSKHPPLLHLPMTVDLERFQKQKYPPSEFKSPYIAFVGVMNNAKDGVNILIESFHKISNDFPELNLYLVGGRNYDTPSHLERIKELKLKERIKWVGEYPRDSIPAIICNARLLVLPRPDSKQAQGGFPTKLGEYLATGVPVCATNVGEIPDYLKDGESVFFAEPASVDSFANSMQLALVNLEEAKKIGTNGRKVAENQFNKDIQSKLLYSYLKQIKNENKK